MSIIFDLFEVYGLVWTLYDNPRSSANHGLTLLSVDPRINPEAFCLILEVNHRKHLEVVYVKNR